MGADSSLKGGPGVKKMLEKAGVPEAKYRLGKTKVFLGVGMLDMLEQARMEYISRKAVAMQMIVRTFLAKRELKRAHRTAPHHRTLPHRTSAAPLHHRTRVPASPLVPVDSRRLQSRCRDARGATRALSRRVIPMVRLSSRRAHPGARAPEARGGGAQAQGGGGAHA
jgi:hypothetical protein